MKQAIKFMTFSIVAMSISLFSNIAYAAKATGEGAEEGVIWQVEDPKKLIQSVRAGGNVIYFRHAPTELKKKDANEKLQSTKVDYKNCKVQRNLSKEGREVAAGIRDQLKRLAVPVQTVYASPYCRTVDTARIIFAKAIFDPQLGYSLSRSAEDSRRLGLYLKNKILKMKPKKSNIIIVGHSSNLRDGLGVWPKPEGVAVVFKPKGDKLIYRGMITPSQWQLVSQ